MIGCHLLVIDKKKTARNIFDIHIAAQHIIVVVNFVKVLMGVYAPCAADITNKHIKSRLNPRQGRFAVSVA